MVELPPALLSTEMHAKIELDSRHRGVMTLLGESVPERQFPDWSMGFRDLDATDARSSPGYSQFLNTPLTDSEFFSDRLGVRSSSPRSSGRCDRRAAPGARLPVAPSDIVQETFDRVVKASLDGYPTSGLRSVRSDSTDVAQEGGGRWASRASRMSRKTRNSRRRSSRSPGVDVWSMSRHARSRREATSPSRRAPNAPPVPLRL